MDFILSTGSIQEDRNRPDMTDQLLTGMLIVCDRAFYAIIRVITSTLINF